MTTITNIASPGAPTQVVAESPVRAPLAHDIAWTTPALGIPLGNLAQIATVSPERIEQAGGPIARR
jgi:hypothetical protein